MCNSNVHRSPVDKKIKEHFKRNQRHPTTSAACSCYYQILHLPERVFRPALFESTPRIAFAPGWADHPHTTIDNKEQTYNGVRQ